MIFRAATAKLGFVTFSPNSQMLATVSDDNTIKIWQTNGNLKAVLRGQINQIINVTFSSDSQRLVSVSDDNTVKVWQVDGKLIQNLKENKDQVKNTAFRETNQIIASVVGAKCKNIESKWYTNKYV